MKKPKLRLLGQLFEKYAMGYVMPVDEKIGQTQYKLSTTLCLLMLAIVPLYAGTVPCERAQHSVSELPIAALTSSYPPQGTIWVKGTITLQTGDDTYIIKDQSGQITLFLPTDQLLALDLKPGMEILIQGTVDVSPVRSDKNELYAQKILIP